MVSACRQTDRQMVVSKQDRSTLLFCFDDCQSRLRIGMVTSWSTHCLTCTGLHIIFGANAYVYISKIVFTVWILWHQKVPANLILTGTARMTAKKHVVHRYTQKQQRQKQNKTCCPTRKLGHFSLIAVTFLLLVVVVCVCVCVCMHT